MNRSKAVRIAPAKRHSALLLLAPIVLAGTVAVMRATAGPESASSSPSGGTRRLDAFAIMIPRTGVRERQPAGRRSLEIVGAHRATTTAFCVVTAQGEKFQCAPDEYYTLRHGGTITASVTYVPPTSPRSTAWLTSHVNE